MGIGDPRTRDVMIPAIDDANDRLREVAYAWLEANPEPPLAPKLIAKLETEVSEFVRPSLVRALAALGSDPKVQAALLKDVTRGEDIFRSAIFPWFDHRQPVNIIRDKLDARGIALLRQSELLS